jgi:ribosomal protein L32
MAGLPKRKGSSRRRDNRRSQDRVKLPQLKVSKKTGKLVPVGRVTKDEPEHKGQVVVK